MQGRSQRTSRKISKSVGQASIAHPACWSSTPPTARPFEPTDRSPIDQLDGQRVDSDAPDREAVVIKRLDVDALEHANEGSWRILAVGPDELVGSDDGANQGFGVDRLAIAVVVFVHQ